MTREEAIVIATNYVNKINSENFSSNEDEGMAFIDEFLTEYEKVFIFYYTSKSYIRTRNELDILLGPGPNIIDKITGEIVSYGSAYSNEDAIEEYFKIKLKSEPIKKRYNDFNAKNIYKIIINSINRKHSLVNFMVKLKITYVIPEVENGVIWRISKPYTNNIVSARLNKLPIYFTMPGTKVIEFCNHVENFNLCDYSIEEYEPSKYESDVKKASQKDYEPEW